MEEKREEIIESLEHLMTTSCILAGFTFSGLIAVPSMDITLFEKFVFFLQGDLTRTLFLTFYALFFTTVLLLGTIVSILVVKGTQYHFPIKKLRRVHFVSNMLFSFALAGLMFTVIIFGLPNSVGIFIASGLSIYIAIAFVYENFNPYRFQQRTQQIKKEETSIPTANNQITTKEPQKETTTSNTAEKKSDTAQNDET